MSIWSLDNKYRPELVIKGHTEPVTCFNFNPSDGNIITGSKVNLLLLGFLSNKSKCQ